MMIIIIVRTKETRIQYQKLGAERLNKVYVLRKLIIA